MGNMITDRELICQKHLSISTGNNADRFSLEEFCEFHSLRSKDAVGLIQSLQDVSIMRDMCEGDFLSFDFDKLIGQIK
jgi:hypothetical protein